MKKHLYILLACALLASCGTHRNVVSTSHTGKTGKTVKETKRDITYKGLPWVENISKPVNITNGLKNKHLSIWASHGRFYDQGKGTWRWQRPNMFCTNEDLFTQTIVVPYLIPMLEKAGAVVFTSQDGGKSRCSSAQAYPGFSGSLIQAS